MSAVLLDVGLVAPVEPVILQTLLLLLRMSITNRITITATIIITAGCRTGGAGGTCVFK